MEEQTPKKFHFTKQMKIGLAVVLVLCIGCGLVYLDTAYGSGKIRSLFVKSSVTQNKGNPSAGVLAEIPLGCGQSTFFCRIRSGIPALHKRRCEVLQQCRRPEME